MELNSVLMESHHGKRIWLPREVEGLYAFVLMRVKEAHLLTVEAKPSPSESSP
jgi:hypothetical protein